MTDDAVLTFDVGIKGNELLIYAVIYGFTQNGEIKFVGSMN